MVTLTALVPLAACSHLPTLPDKPAPYRLGAGDELEIKAIGADELTGQYLVQDDGTIKMLLIGEVPATGLTLNQLENEIDKKLMAGHYLKQPRITVVLLDYRPYFILGEVGGQGAYPYVSGMKVLTAAAAAGGYTRRANQNYAIITRNGEDYRADPLTPIEPGDIIRVP
ncbi:MAG: polysaccharide biosynthesis/export family protein [Alphaproteobacteria bacterium]|nr:polysaccharide biosynthesis/export family protein [Alphaproteobacteria bacterium]